MSDQSAGEWELMPEPSGQPVSTAKADWYADPYGGVGQLRWFDGLRWTAHLQPDPGYQPPISYAPQMPVVMMASPGGGGAASAVAVTTGPNHLLHFVLTLLTCGLWLPVWICVAIFGGRTSVATSSAGGGGGGVVMVQYPPQQYPPQQYPPQQYPPQQ